MRKLLPLLGLLLCSTVAVFAARSFNGSTGEIHSAATIDLTGAGNVISISFWLWENAFDSGDELAVESSTNFNSNSGAFIIDPNSGSTFDFGINVSGGTGSKTFTRPSAAAWHHYLIVLSEVSGANWKAYVDGTSQTLSGSGTAGGTFGNFTIYLMSRAGSSLFNAGRLAEFAIWKADESGNVAALAAGGLASATDSGNLVQYVQICGTASPEPDQVSGNWTVTGTTQIAHPPAVTGDCLAAAASTFAGPSKIVGPTKSD